jgi:hypothetical protein
MENDAVFDIVPPIHIKTSMPEKIQDSGASQGSEAPVTKPDSAMVLAGGTRQYALSLLKMVAPGCEASCADEGECRNADTQSAVCAAALAILSGLDGLSANLSRRRRFLEALRNIENGRSEDGGAEGVVSQSLDLLREHLQMDYAGISLFMDGKRTPVHQSGSKHEGFDESVVDAQVAEAIKHTGQSGEYAYLCPSDSEDGGIDAVIVFRDAK